MLELYKLNGGDTLKEPIQEPTEFELCGKTGCRYFRVLGRE
jgi:hypothetical protein